MGTMIGHTVVSDRVVVDDVVVTTNTDDMLIPIPGRSAARGEITHKRLKDMNRKERRAVMSGKR